MAHTYEELIKKSTQLRARLYRLCNNIIRKYPYIRQENDVRITFFSKSFVVIDSGTLSFIFADNYLKNKKWWTIISKKYSLKPIPLNVRPAIKHGFAQFTLLGYFHFIFSAMESTLRLITKQIDPIQYQNKQSSFDQVYSFLIDKLVKNQRRKKKCLKVMKMLILIRNTIHNNGVYFPVSKRPRDKHFLFVTLTFCNGEPYPRPV